LCSTDPYDEDDAEADDIWDAVDERMDMRRKVRRETRIKEELHKYREKKPSIQRQFADLKRSLVQMSQDDWAGIPEAGSIAKRKKAEVERYSAVPDSLLDKAKAESEATLMPDVRTPVGGLETPGIQTPAGSMTDMTQIGEGRNTILSLKLDRVSDSVSGQTVVDPKGYLTDLNSIKTMSDADIGDIKQARLLFQNAIATNRRHAPAWIAAARLEVLAGKIGQARSLIREGCLACSKNEDVWLEAAKLNTPENAKRILAEAVEHLPQSVKIWMHAADMEETNKAKRRVLRKALELVPNAVRLWKAAVELESAADARIMLSRAVEDGCCPLSVELWLALAQLESYENARAVLNNARNKLPHEPAIWLTAAKLEEANNNAETAPRIVERALKSFAQQQLKIATDRDFWLKEAEEAEKQGYPRVAEAIIRATSGINVEDLDRKRVWVADADALLSKNCVACARAILAHALTAFPGKKRLWMKAAQLEKRHGSGETLDALLSKATTYCPKAWQLWLMGAKEKWLAGDVDAARLILNEAFSANADNEEIWLAAVKLENENNEPERARLLLGKAREQCGTPRVWMRSAQHERQHGQVEAERSVLAQATDTYPTFAKLWMMRVQLEERVGDLETARSLYAAATKLNPSSVALWRVAVAVEISDGNYNRARALLEKARLKNPATAELWLDTVRLEAKADNKKLSEARMAQALQECPTSGLLWAEAIMMEPRAQRKAKSIDAVKRCENDPLIICTVARLFWADRKIDRARTWFNRAVTLNPDLGDAWAYYYKFTLQHGNTPDAADEVVRRCKEAEPAHGELWQATAKAADNWHQPVETILKKVAAQIK